jgi:outer membrane protein TolC
MLLRSADGGSIVQIPRRVRAPRARTLFAAPALLALVAPVVAAAQQSREPLSLERALEMARNNNPAYQAARNDQDVADWDVRSAYGALAPSASVGAGVSWQGAGSQQFGSITLDELGFGGQPSYYFSSYNLGLNYRLDGRVLLGPSQAKATRASTSAQVELARVTLETDVTLGYLEALRQRDGVELARQQLERTRFNLRLVEGQSEVGTASPLDVRQAEVQVGRAEVTLLRAETAARTARLRLLQVLGVSLDDRFELVTEFTVEPPAWTDEALLDMAFASNPSLESRRRGRDAAVVEVRMARSAYLPSLSMNAGWSGFTRQASDAGYLIAQSQAQVNGQVQQCQATNDLYARLADPLPPLDCSRFAFTDEDRQRIRSQNDAFPFDFERNPPSASLSLSIPVFQGLSRQRQLEAARAQRDDADHQVREQELALEADVTIRLAEVRAAHRSAELEERNQTLADEQLRLAQERYRLGFIPFLDLVDAETLKAEADRDLLNAVYGYHDALAALEAAVGRSLRPN